MKAAIARILLLLVVMGLCSGYLSSFARKQSLVANNEGLSLSTWLVKTLNVKDLVVGFLWLRFDTDSGFQLANYHRLLLTLDAITAIKEDEFDAWSLKNYMRLDRSIRTKDAEMKERALKDYRLACQLNPDDWHYYHDAAQMIYQRMKEPHLALKYAQKANSLPDHGVKAQRLLAHIYYELDMYDKSAEVYRNILNNPQADALEVRAAETMLKLLAKISR